VVNDALNSIGKPTEQKN